MYDVDRMNLGDKLFVADRYIGRNQTPYGKETNFLNFLGKTVGNALSVGQEAIDFALRRSGNLLGGVFGADWKGEYETS